MRTNSIPISKHDVRLLVDLVWITKHKRLADLNSKAIKRPWETSAETGGWFNQSNANHTRFCNRAKNRIKLQGLLALLLGQPTWYLLVELNGISQIFLLRALYSVTRPMESSTHLRRADSEASPLHSLFSTGTFSWSTLNSARLHSIAQRARFNQVGLSLPYSASAMANAKVQKNSPWGKISGVNEGMSAASGHCIQ